MVAEHVILRGGEQGYLADRDILTPSARAVFDVNGLCLECCQPPFPCSIQLINTKTHTHDQGGEWVYDNVGEFGFTATAHIADGYIFCGGPSPLFQSGGRITITIDNCDRDVTIRGTTMGQVGAPYYFEPGLPLGERWAPLHIIRHRVERFINGQRAGLFFNALADAPRLPNEPPDWNHCALYDFIGTDDFDPHNWETTAPAGDETQVIIDIGRTSNPDSAGGTVAIDVRWSAGP